MIDPDNVPPVADEELLARFATQSKQFRKSDHTVKQNLFIPHPHDELSVTRHRDATDAEIWYVARDVVGVQNRTLYGRADILASDCCVNSLHVVESPIPDNPNHADIKGWPPSKEDKKALAQKLAAVASKLIKPPLRAI